MAVQTAKKSFHQADFATKLRIPEDTPYVDATAYEDVKAALEQGVAVHVESCAARAFLWKSGDKILADMFFHSPAQAFEFNSIDEAADWASELCEGSGITD